MANKLSIGVARAVAESKGGVCLSEKYINTDTKLLWRCKEGHEWSAKLNHVKDSGSWCPNCAHRKPVSMLEKAKAHARKNRGQCLSEKFETIKSELIWQCAGGHQWASTYTNTVFGKHWCPHCVGRFNNSINVAKQLAQEKGGDCLSEAYTNAYTHLRWKCGDGHEWSAGLTSVKTGTWCPVCIGHYDHLPKMRQLAGSKGGKCLAAAAPATMKTHVAWECAAGHQWEATPDNVLNNKRWCPRCRFRSEEEVRSIFEGLTGKPFPKKRGILQNGRMELDGYNNELRVAFEYQGAQHYEYIPHFHREGPNQLEQQQQRDRLKEELCTDAWIALVIVPYDTLDIQAFIQKELYLLGVIDRS